MDQSSIEDLVNFINGANKGSDGALMGFRIEANIRDVLPQIKTGVVLGGYNGSDRDKFYESLELAAEENNIMIATLESVNGGNVKECMKKIIDQFITKDSSVKKVYPDFDIERLVIAMESVLFLSHLGAI